jgi:hypothetical protein
LTQATPERLGERIKQAAEGKHSQGIQMDRRREQVSLVLHDAPRQLQSVKMLNIVMKVGELNDQMEVGEMTQGIMRNGGNGELPGSQREQKKWMLPPNSITRCIPNKSVKPKQMRGESESIDLYGKRGVGMRSSGKPRGVSTMQTRRRVWRASRKRIGMYGEGWLDQQNGHRAETQLKMPVMHRRLPKGASRQSTAIWCIASRGKSKDICKRPRGNKDSCRIGWIEKSKAVEGNERMVIFCRQTENKQLS